MVKTVAPYSYDVFISYSRADQAVANRLNEWLSAQGLRTFYDRQELAPGLPWVAALEQAIAASGAVAILFGPQGIGNTQQYEIELALVRQTGNRSFPVIPVLLPGSDNPPVGFLQLLTWADMRAGHDLLDCPAELQALLAAIRREPVTSAAIRGTICPYMGLEAFREEDAAFFCGRDDVIAALVAKIPDHAFVAVVGRSGSGKSSVVEAGLVPALRRQYKSIVWDTVTLKPGAWPLQSLAACFNAGPPGTGVFAADAALEGEAAALRQGDPDRLARVVSQRLATMPEQPDRLLIHVDQWEELYSRAPPSEQAEAWDRHEADVVRFIDLLLAAGNGAAARTHVVVTVRIDFYGQVIRHPGLNALLPGQQVNLGPLSRDDLRAAIIRPAEKVGLHFAPPALVDHILDDVGRDERMLPLLQYALKETWVRREQDALTAEGYADAGGVQAAIQTTAQRTFDALSPSEQAAAKRLFLGLVSPGEGQEDTRTRALIPDDALTRRVVEKFADRKARLLVTGSETAPGTPPATPLGDAEASTRLRPTVEITHEALIRSWHLLQTWVRESRDKLRSRAAVLQAMRQWEENGRRDDLLLQPGFQLERGRDLLADPGEVPVDDLRRFIAASFARDERLTRERVEREQAELRREIEFRRRQSRNRTITLSIVAGSALISLVFAGVALWQIRSASAQQNEVQARALWSQLDFSNQQGALSEGDVAGLWALATAPPAAQARFVDDLRVNPLAYVPKLRHARPVFVALRLTEGSQLVADMLDALLDALQLPTLPTPNTIGILQVLAPLLTDAQTDRVFDALLPRLQPLTDGPSAALMQMTSQIGETVSDDLAAKLLPVGLADVQDPQDRTRWVRGAVRLAAAEAKPPDTIAALDWCQHALAATKDLDRERALALGVAALAQNSDPSLASRMIEAVTQALAQLAHNEPRADTPDYDSGSPYAEPAAWILANLAQQALALADNVPAADIVARIGPLVQLASTMDGVAIQGPLIEALRHLARRLDPTQAFATYSALRTTLRASAAHGRPSDIPYLVPFSDVIRIVASKIPPADVERELVSGMQLLVSEIAAAPASVGAPAWPIPPERQVWARRTWALVLLDAGLAGVAAPGSADRLIELLARSRDSSDLVGPAFFTLVAPRLGNPTATFEAALAEARDEGGQSGFDQSKPTRFGWAAADVAAAIADTLPPDVAARQIDALSDLLEDTNRKNDYQMQALANSLTALAAKIGPAEAVARFDRLVGDLSHGGNSAVLADLANSSAALGRRLAPASAATRLLDLIDRISTLPPFVGQTPMQGYIPIQAFAVVAQGVATTASSSACAEALDRIIAVLAASPSYDERIAFSQVGSALTAQLDAPGKARAKQLVLFSLQRSLSPFEAGNWTAALLPLLKAEPVEQFAADIIEVWKYPNAADQNFAPVITALREARPGAPELKVGFGAYQQWIAKTYPTIDLHSPPAWIPVAQILPGAPPAR
jgi:hypothetical protein